MRVLTVATVDFLPFARAMAESVREHHPDVQIAAVIADGVGIPDEPLFDVLMPSDIGIDDRELRRRRAMYGPQALATSIRPMALLELVGRYDEPILFLDADCLVLGPVDDLVALAADHGIVLTPHTPAPLRHVPGRRGPEGLFAQSGVFNAGVIAVDPRARPFLQWWYERTRRDTVNDVRHGLLMCQSWLALVPALFEHTVLRDPGVNLTWHGLHESDVEWEDGVPSLGGRRVRLFHFAGYDPARPGVFALPADTVEPPTMAQRPGAAWLADAYRERLLAAGWVPGIGRSGRESPLDDAAREAYRTAVIAAEAGHGALPPDPFADLGAFDAWLREAAPGLRVPRDLLALRARRQDLELSFPAVPGDDEDALLDWSLTTLAPPGQTLQAAACEATRHGLLAGERPPLARREPDALRSWLAAPAPGTTVSRFVLALWRLRPDLREAYPDVPGGDEPALRDWAMGRTELSAGHPDALDRALAGV